MVDSVRLETALADSAAHVSKLPRLKKQASI